jgi:hypothetical protein
MLTYFVAHVQVQMLEGAINGIRVRFIDTPGLQAAASAVGYNARVLGQIRKAHKKYKPDNVLYFDRSDVVSALPRCLLSSCMGPVSHARRTGSACPAAALPLALKWSDPLQLWREVYAVEMFLR